VPTLKGRRVSPHTFRHTMGVAMVTAGVDITVIRSWLGHVSLAHLMRGHSRDSVAGEVQQSDIVY
jgi:integrase